VERVPAAGEIVHAEEAWAEPGGAAPVAAVQLLKLAGEATLYTALGDDELGHRAKRELEALGLRVVAVFRPGVAQRVAITFVDGGGERTITTIGSRLGPSGEDPLPWDELATTQAVYFTAGDRGALEAARRAKFLTATTREFAHLVEWQVPLDAVIGSARDPGEEYRPGLLHPEPKMVVLTAGADGGTYRTADGRSGTFRPAPIPGPVVDAYGAGDSFAGGLTYGLGAGMPPEGALELAARCGAANLTGRGPYQGQLRLTEPPPPG